MSYWIPKGLFALEREENILFFLKLLLKILIKRQLCLRAGISSWCWISRGHWWFKGCYTDASEVVVQFIPGPKNSTPEICKTSQSTQRVMQEAARITAEQMGVKFWMKASRSQKTDLNSVLRSSKADSRTTSSKQFLRGTLILSDRDCKDWKKKKKGKKNKPHRRQRKEKR